MGFFYDSMISFVLQLGKFWKDQDSDYTNLNKYQTDLLQ